MRKLFLFLLFVPACACAQLDRVRTDMTEAAFNSTFPEAQRDRSSEWGWVRDTATLYGIKGEASWQITNDSIACYDFSSAAVEGPSAGFPKVDSAAVHQLKVAAESFRNSMQLQLGAPATFVNRALTVHDPMNGTVVYLAEWLSAEGKIIRVTVKRKLRKASYEPNAPVKSAPDAALYELSVLVAQQTVFTRAKYFIGKPAVELLQKYPALGPQAAFRLYHEYVITDTLTCAGSGWRFTFHDGKLIAFAYTAWCPANGDAAKMYRLMKIKTETFLAQGNTAFGKPLAVENKLTRKYKPSRFHTAYKKQWFGCAWQAGTDTVSLIYSETGGGKNTAVQFNLKVSCTKHE